MKIALVLFGIVALSLAIVFFFFPKVIMDIRAYYFMQSAGVSKKIADVDGYVVYYYMNEYEQDRETIVFIHGLGDDKDSFLQVAAYFKKDYNLILPDLKGHGDGMKKPKLDYSIKGQMQYLYTLLETLGIKKTHIVGNSMGGHIATAYTANYPEFVISLTIINATGVVVEKPIYADYTDFPQSRKDLYASLGEVLYEVPYIPPSIAKYMIHQTNVNRKFANEHIFPDMRAGEYIDLKQEIQTIKNKSLILWGKYDEVVPLEVGEYYRDNLENSEFIIIDKASHAPQIDRSKKVAELIGKFIKK